MVRIDDVVSTVPVGVPWDAAALQTHYRSPCSGLFRPCGTRRHADYWIKMYPNMRIRAVIALGIVLACCACASALDPSLDISQYAHTAWKIRDGFFKGRTFSMAQTPDGYLWLGTEFGLLRFDGVRTFPWPAPAGESLPSDFILSLLAARDGRLWIGADGGLASWKDGKLTHYPDLDGQSVVALLEDREGTVWAAAREFPVGDSVRCGTAAHSVTDRTAVSACSSKLCTKIPPANSG